MRDNKRDDRSHNSRKYARDRSNSVDRGRNRSDGHQSKYRYVIFLFNILINPQGCYF